MTAAIDDLAAFATPEALGSPLHGPRHWRDVARAGLALLAGEPAADPAVVLLFAALHDTQRHDDGADPGHGPRAAEVVARLQARGVLGLDDDQAATVRRACELHTVALPGEVAAGPTEAVCFDADRLTLWRVGITPDARYLFTATGRELSRGTWSRDLVRGPDRAWADIRAAVAAG